MKKILLTLISIYMIFISYSQLPYSWPSGSNPGWTSSNPGLTQLSWQSGIPGVSTSGFSGGWYAYTNSQITEYKSPFLNFTSCNTSQYVQVNIRLDIDLENIYDWLYFQYSINGGTTWNNPVVLSTSTNNSGVNLSTYSPLTNWINNNSNRNGWTGYLGIVNVSYIIPKTTNQFRFIFASDGSVNTWGGGFIYYADILNFAVTCPVLLSIELLTFNGINQNNINILTWSTASEDNNDYFTLERSEDGEKWEEIKQIDGAGNSQEELHYSCVDNTYKNVINYYRLSQTDNDGSKKYFDPIAINNTYNKKEILKVVNSLGQIVDINTKGVLFIIYTDGKIKRIVNY